MDFGGGDFNPKGDENIFRWGGDHHKDHRDTISHHYHGAVVKSTLVFVLIGLTCFLLNQSDNSTQLVKRSYPDQAKLSPPSLQVKELVSSFREIKSEDLSSYEKAENNLEKTLKSAAMEEHKTVIITTLNAAWTEPNSIFDLFLESFKIGDQTQTLLKHVVVVAFDQKAYSRCLEANLHCFDLGVDFSGQAYFMSGGYLKMMWKRIDFLRSVLEMGYNFVFSCYHQIDSISNFKDADIMWLRDPFPRFYPDGDFQIACDMYKHNSTDLRNYPNGGFTYVRSNNRTIQFYKFWYTAKDYFPGKHDQDVFNMIKFNPFIAEIGLEIRFLDTAYFGGFCQPSKDLDAVATMHANCCVGLGNKIHDIKMVLEDWKRYMDHNSSTWTIPRRCGLKKSGNN